MYRQIGRQLDRQTDRQTDRLIDIDEIKITPSEVCIIVILLPLEVEE